MISASIAVNIALFGLIGPFAASVMDRWGLRRVVCGALALMAVAVACSTQMSAEWRKVNVICTLEGDRVVLKQQPMAAMRPDLFAMFDTGELKKYYTEAELPPEAGTAQPADSEETKN